MKKKFLKFFNEIVVPAAVITSMGNLLALIFGTFSIVTLFGGFGLVLMFICFGEMIEYITTPKMSKMEQFSETLRNVDKK